MPSPDAVDSFISRWGNSGAAERANYQMFLSELCDLLEVPRPDPTSPDPDKNLYVFDRAITRVNPDGSSVTNYIDLYKARHFVCETKQGASDCSVGLRPSLTTSGREAAELSANPAISADLSPSIGIDAHRAPLQPKLGHGRRGSAAFDKALERAYNQGRDYITHLPAGHGRPPFLVVCDVGHSIDLYSEFTCTGGRYERFTAKEKQIHDQGLVTLLKQLHDELDAAVLEAYGWQDLSANASHCSGALRASIANEQAPSLVPNGIDGHRPPLQSMEQELLTRLVALNHERAAEEQRGLIRWLRPEYQNCSGGLRPSHDASVAASDAHRPPLQDELPGTESASSSSQSKIQNQQSSIINPSSSWPDRLPDQVTLIRQLLATAPAATPEQLSARFGRKNQKRTEQIEGIIETLRGLGQV